MMMSGFISPLKIEDSFTVDAGQELHPVAPSPRNTGMKMIEKEEAKNID